MSLITRFRDGLRAFERFAEAMEFDPLEDVRARLARLEAAVLETRGRSENGADTSRPHPEEPCMKADLTATG
jgi:hypothetical protein